MSKLSLSLPFSTNILNLLCTLRPYCPSQLTNVLLFPETSDPPTTSLSASARTLFFKLSLYGGGILRGKAISSPWVHECPHFHLPSKLPPLLSSSSFFTGSFILMLKVKDGWHFSTSTNSHAPFFLRKQWAHGTWVLSPAPENDLISLNQWFSNWKMYQIFLEGLFEIDC